MMKQLKAVAIVSVFFVLLTSEKRAVPSILGYWEIYMTINNGKTETDRKMAMVFNPEGKLELISKKRGDTMNGKWKLKKGGKAVKISFDNKEVDHGIYKIESLTYDELILEQKGNKVFFDRGEKSEQ